MTAVYSNQVFSPGIGSITISGTQMNTWRDKNQAILRLVKVAPTLKPGIMAYALQECNQSTIKNAAQFESFLAKNLIYVYTNKGELISFPNQDISEEIEKKPHIYGLLKGANTSILTPKEVIRMTNPDNVADAKTQLKKISNIFEKVVPLSRTS